MRFSVPIAKSTRTTWRTNAREIAAALDIPVNPDQWVMIESAEDDGTSVPFDQIEIVRWEAHQPSTYQHEIAGEEQS